MIYYNINGFKNNSFILYNKMDFIINKKKNDKLITKRFDKFIKQEKDFNDDIFGVIKDFMIDKTYFQSYRFVENRELRYCNSDVDATSFYVGKRWGNLIQVKKLRDDNVIYYNEPYKMYKINTLRVKKDENNIIYIEFITILSGTDYDEEDGTINNIFYMIGADKFKNPLWTDEDTIKYNIWVRETIERDEEEVFEEYIDEIEEMMY